MHLSNHPTFSNRRTNNHRNCAIRVAIPKCNRPCNIQACKQWGRAILHKDEDFINPIKALSNSCNPIPQGLNRALKVGLASSHQGLEATGGPGPDSHNDDSDEMSYEANGMMSPYIHT